MATINHGSGADIIVPNNNGTTYRGLGGDDTYILSNSIAANAAITIVDTSGANKIQLVDGLSVASTKFAADAVQLTLTNGAVVTINGASNFSFDLGGNSTAGTSGTVKNFAGFAVDAGVATLPVSGSVAGASNVSVSGTSWSSGGSASYTVASSSTKVTEGSNVTFTITSNTAVSADTTFSWTVIGDTNGGTVDKAGTSDIDVLSGTATIASGSTSTTFNVTPTTDAVVEGIEGIKVSVFDSSSNAISSSKILVDNGGSSATSATFILTTGVDNFTGRSGNDSFDATTLASLNDYDVLDGGDGTDTLTVKIATVASGQTIIPQFTNIENIQVTNETAVDSIADDDVLSISTAGLTGIKTVTNIAGRDAVTFNDLANPVDIKIKSAPNDTEVNFNATALTGANDEITLTLAGTANSSLVLTDDNITASSTLESLTIDSIGVANVLDTLETANVNIPALTITGSTKLTITGALDASIVSVDASASTGGLVLTGLPAAPVAISIVGSSKADTLTSVGTGTTTLSMGGGNDTADFNGLWTAKDTYDGGDGTDTLRIDGDVTNVGINSTIFGNLSNVEVLAVDTAHSITLDKNTPFSVFDLAEATDQDLNLNDGYTQATSVKIGADLTDNINNNANVDLTLTANSAGITAALDVTGSIGKNDVANIINTAAGTSTFDTGNDVFETINLVPFTVGANIVLVTGAYALGATGGSLTVNAGGLDAGAVVTFTGTDSATPMIVTTGPAADIIVLGTKSDILISGAGNDSITGTAGSNNITSGDGVDTIVLGSGASIIDAGAGNDIITAGANLANTDVIDGGAGTDTLTTTGAIASSSVMGGVSNIEIINPIGAIDTTFDGPMGGATTFLINDANAQVVTFGGAGKTWTADTIVSITAATATENKKIANSANVDLTIKVLDTDVETGFSVVGGSGSDVLEITAGGDAGADIDAVTGVEKIVIKDSATAGTDSALIVNNNITTATETLVIIDASELDGSASADEVFTLTGDASQVPLSVIGGGGSDALDGGLANDTISGGTGADTIDGNEGLDNLSGGAGNDIFTLNAKTEYSTAYGTDIIDGGVGTDTVTFTGSQNLSAAQLVSITNTEKWTIPAGSEFTISDTVIANNPGLAFNFAGAGTLTTGEDTAGGSLMSTSLNITSTATGALKLIGSSSVDTFTFQQTEELDAADTIDGNGGIDIIYIENDDEAVGGIGDGVGVATTATLGVSVTNVEKLVVSDLSLDDNAGDVTVNLTAGMTQTAFEVDGSSLDANVTTTDGERLTVTNADNLKLTALGGSFSDSLTGGSGADILTGNGGADTLVGGDGNDIISGGSGADIITGGLGVDNLSGGDANDIFLVTDDAAFKVSGGVETVNGGLGTDTLSFTEGAALTLTAPELSKLYSIEKITLASNATVLTFGNETFTNLDLGTGSLQITTTTTNNIVTIDGSAVSNGSFLIVDDGANTNLDKFVGGSGDDTFRFKSVTGLSDGDTVTGGAGNDTIQLDNTAAVTAMLDFNEISGVENVTIYTSAATGLTAGALIITINPNLTAALNKGNVTIDLSGKNVSTSVFNTGNDDTVNIDFTIIGGSVADDIAGSLGDDTISGGGTLVGDTLEGGSGNDSITGNSGADTIVGGNGNDEGIGGAGNDIINGNDGNDTLAGGDGTDTIEGDAGPDTLTGGAGNDIFKYDLITDSSGNTKDTITDFKQSTLNATTGAQVSNGDSISLVVTSGAVANGGPTSFILSDKGDVANAGEAVNSMNNSVGSFVFAKDNDVLYIDMDGDSTLNTDDYAFTLTGLDSFHGADIDVTVSGEDSEVTTITTLDGNDIITTGSAADIINSGAGNDIIVAGAGANIINSGAGNDNITGGAVIDTINAGAGNDIIVGAAGADIITGGTGDDVFTAVGVVAANRTLIQDFEDAGDTVGDVVHLLRGATEFAGAANVQPVMVQVAVTLVGNGITYDLEEATGSIEGASLAAFNTNAVDIIELTGLRVADGNLAIDFGANSGVELLKMLSTGATAASVTADGADDDYYVIAADTNVTVIYKFDGTTDGADVAADLIPVLMFNSTIAAGAFVEADFLMI